MLEEEKGELGVYQAEDVSYKSRLCKLKAGRGDAFLEVWSIRNLPFTTPGRRHHCVDKLKGSIQRSTV